MNIYSLYKKMKKSILIVGAGLDLSNGIAEKFGKEGSSGLIRKRS
jgi:hypothetical protein